MFYPYVPYTLYILVMPVTLHVVKTYGMSTCIYTCYVTEVSGLGCGGLGLGEGVMTSGAVCAALQVFW